MSALPRGFDAAARQYDSMTPPDPVEIDTAEYEQQLRESNDFRTETIGNDAQAIADAYVAQEHLPHVIDCILDDAAERVIAQALADSNDTTARGLHEACREMVSRFTRYDRRAA